MACPTNKTTILNGIRNKIAELTGFERVNDNTLSSPNASEDLIEEINMQFEEEVLVPAGEGLYTIQVSDELLEFYEGYLEDASNYLEEDRNANLPTTPTSTMDSVKAFMGRSGIKFEEVENITINGKNISANGIALPLESLVLYTQGNESLVLSEEAFHIGVELLSQKQPELFQKMMDQVSSLPLYKSVLAEYKNDEFYQKNGKPDINKIKKEAIGKALAASLAPKSWWTQIKDFLKSLFKGYRENLDVFTKAVDVILQEDLGTVRDTLLKSESYLLAQGLDEQQAEQVIALAYSNITDEEVRIAIADMIPKILFESVAPSEVQRAYTRLKELSKTLTLRAGQLLIDGKVPKRTDLDAGKKVLNTSSEQKSVSRRIEERLTTDVYKDSQNILNRYIDSDGYLRLIPEPFTDSRLARKDYDDLEAGIQENLKAFPPDTKFLVGTNVVSKDRAGSIDLLALTPDGKANVLMFQEIKVPAKGRLETYEQKAYREVLDSNLAVLKELGYKKFGTTRIIPVNNESDLQISVVDPAFENIDYLMPIPSSQETTGVQAIDTLVKKLNGLAARLRDTPATFGTQFKKSQEIGNIFKSIRGLSLQRDIKPLTIQAAAVNKRLQQLIKRYESDFKGKKVTEPQKQAFSAEIMMTRQVADTFSSIRSFLAGVKEEDLFSTKDEINDLRRVSGRVLESQDQIDSILRDFTDEHIATPLGVTNILKPETVVKMLKRNFSQLSRGATAAVETLYKIINPITHRIDIEQSEEIKRLTKLKDDYTKYAEGQGLTTKNLFSPITKKDSKGRYQNELIDEYSPKFYEDLRKAQENNDTTWLKNNIDTKAYEDWYKDYKIEEFELIDLTTYSNDPVRNAEIQKEEKQKFEDTFDISKNASIYNKELKNYPLEKWQSDEYKAIKNQPAALAFYNYIREKNTEAAELGVLEEWRSRAFLPSVRKDLVDKTVFGGSVKLGEGFLQSISANKEDYEYGKVDPDTGELKDNIPFYFIHDLSNKMVDANGDTYRDYSMVSTDLFKVMEMYNRQILKYKYLSEVENQIKIVSLVEAAKPALATSPYGDNIEEGEEIKNVDNHKFLENFIKASLYGQKNVGGEWDAKLGKIATKWAEKANKALGRQVFSEDFDGNTIALSRVVDATNRLFSLKVLGLNVPVTLANFFGTSVNAWIEAGKFFSKSEFGAMEFGVMMGKMNGKRDTNLVGAVDYFIPLMEGETNADKARQLSLSKITQFSFPELLMRVQTLSDRPVQWAIAGAYIQNTMVDNGKLVNIREYLRSTPEYANMYDLPQDQRTELRQQFENKVKELQDTRSILVTGKIVDDVFTIPGIERNSQEVYEFREKIQQLARNATGMGNKDDIRQINLSLVGRSVMMFKNWLPRLAERRFGALERVPITGEYEWGRMKVMMNLLGKGVLKSAANLNNVITLNDAGVSLLKDEYLNQKAKYEERTGKDFDMSQADFIEMYSRAIKNQMQELLVLMSLLGIVLAAKALPPEDEDPKVKGFYKYALRLVDKFQNELSFFYNPVEWAKMGSGGIFPAFGVVSDISKATSHILKEAVGDITGNEELQESAKPAKYIMKNFPMLRAFTPYMAIFLSETAQQDWGITPTSEFQSR